MLRVVGGSAREMHSAGFRYVLSLARTIMSSCPELEII